MCTFPPSFHAFKYLPFSFLPTRHVATDQITHLDCCTLCQCFRSCTHYTDAMETTFLLFPSLRKQLIFLPSTPPQLSTVQCPALRPHARVAAYTILPSPTTRSDEQTFFSQQLVLRFYMHLMLFNLMYMYIQPLRIIFQIQTSRRPPDFYAGRSSGNSKPFCITLPNMLCTFRR